MWPIQRRHGFSFMRFSFLSKSKTIPKLLVQFALTFFYFFLIQFFFSLVFFLFGLISFFLIKSEITISSRSRHGSYSVNYFSLYLFIIFRPLDDIFVLQSKSPGCAMWTTCRARSTSCIFVRPLALKQA